MNTRHMRRTAKAFGGFLAKNSPTVLTVISVAGLISTSILVGEGTLKAHVILEEERDLREQESLTGAIDPIILKEAAILTWKCYVPAAIMGAVTISCIIGANSVHTRRNAALAGLYSLSEAALKEYKNKVIETIGENKHREIRDEIAGDRIRNNPIGSTVPRNTGYGDTLCYDALSGRYFKSDIEQIRRTMNDLSRALMSEMFISLNEVYYALGMSHTKLGDLMGFNIDDGLLEPDFSSQLTEEGIPCLVLDFTVEPRYTYRD